MRYLTETLLRVWFFLALLSLSPTLSNANEKYDRMIIAASERYFGVQSDWLWHKARIRQESNFDPEAVSWVGARGLTQFMPRTAKEYGATSVEMMHDPTWSIDAMVRYIRDIWNYVKRSAGDESVSKKDMQMLCDAGYNYGQGRVVKIAKRKSSFTWDSVHASLPKETREYSPRIQKWKSYYAKGIGIGKLN